MKRSVHILFGLIFIFMAVYAGTSGFAGEETAVNTETIIEEAILKDIIVTNTRDDLLLYLKVKGAFTGKLKKIVLSGVPVTFSYLITVDRQRSFWFDKEIVDFTVMNTLKYDTMKKEFVVTRSWDKANITVTHSFDEAQKLISELDSLRVVPLERLEKGQQYTLSAKAELDKITLPFYLHYVLFFVSLWDFETDWHTAEFIY